MKKGALQRRILLHLSDSVYFCDQCKSPYMTATTLRLSFASDKIKQSLVVTQYACSKFDDTLTIYIYVLWL